MAGGLAGLLDDVAALAKLAAASVDDVGVAAGRASVKAAGVVVDDAAVTPAYVRGLAADRELPIIKSIALGSLRNKVLIILPVALLLSSVAPTLALKEVLDEPVVSRGVILAVVGVLITVAVYGVVALIVKMDDVGLKLVERGPGRAERTGRLLVRGMPKLLAWLSVVGTAAMLWVGGHILLVGADELGWTTPYHLVHELEHLVDGVGAIGGVLAWLANTAASAVVGFAVGAAVASIAVRVAAVRTPAASTPAGGEELHG